MNRGEPENIVTSFRPKPPGEKKGDQPHFKFVAKRYSVPEHYDVETDKRVLITTFVLTDKPATTLDCIITYHLELAVKP
ncbi:jg8959 [Pararge aegeria aegeria]|uniref:Jg8959 protein n=1 Tax=Pararge aegeria aegeria TaxID=348720 RepID=A0A8S4S726_9NEOP|nr:jg8959 [Pararge aegeria aegeria]